MLSIRLKRSFNDVHTTYCKFTEYHVYTLFATYREKDGLNTEIKMEFRNMDSIQEGWMEYREKDLDRIKGEVMDGIHGRRLDGIQGEGLMGQREKVW